MDERFVAALDAAAANRGVLIYFTAGNYKFKDSIYLKSGIVICG